MVHDPDPLLERATAAVITLGERLLRRGEQVAVAESCTGGWLAKVLTDRAGSSAWFERGVVVYSNAAKADLLGVPPALIERHGAVSREVAEAMARGLRERAPVAWTAALTGVAGPGGGTAAKPVGTVWIAWAGEAAVEVEGFRFDGDRDAVRRAAVAAALDGLLRRVA